MTPEEQAIPEETKSDDKDDGSRRGLLVLPLLIGGGWVALGSGHGHAGATNDAPSPVKPAMPKIELKGSPGAEDGMASKDATIGVGHLPPGASWEYRISDGPWKTGVGDELSATTLGGDGLVSLQVRVVQNGVAGDAAELHFSLDTSAVTPTLSLHSDAATADGRPAHPEVQVGGLEQGASWSYSVDGGTTWREGTGTTIPSNAVGSDGPVQVLVRQTDRAGNVSPAAELAFVLDTGSAMPVIQLVDDTGAADRVTADARVAVSGLKSGARWEFSLDGGTQWQSGGADGQIPASQFTADGNFTVLARQIDATGKASPAASLNFTRDTATNAPTEALVVDSGASGTDEITADARIAVSGLESGGTFQYRVGGGNWQPGSGGGIAAAAFAEGANALEVRQTDGQGNVGPASLLNFTLKTGTETLDLDSAAGVQPTLLTTAGRPGISLGTALTHGFGSLTATDLLRELRLHLGGNGLDLDHDLLRLDREIVLNAGTAASNVSIGGLDGLSYRYDAAAQDLTLWRADGSALTGAMAAAITGAILLRNGEPSPRAGERLVELSYQDVAGNMSPSSQVTINVDTRQPTVDLNGAQPGVDLNRATRQLVPAAPLFAVDTTVAHENPAARFSKVRLELSGPGASRDDQLVSGSGGGATVLAGASANFAVDGTAWTMGRVSDTFNFSRADGGTASLAEVQAMLRSLQLTNPLADPLQGARRFDVSVVDWLGHIATASSTVVFDSVAPAVDLNGRAPGIDRTVAATPGIPWAFPFARPATGGLTETDSVNALTLHFSSSVNGAFDGAAVNKAEWVGFFDEAHGGDHSDMLRLGRGGTLSVGNIVAGKTVTLTMTAGNQPVLTVTSDTPMTQEEASGLLRALNYEADLNTRTGTRSVQVSATDRAGNTTSAVATATLDVRAIDTPVILLSHDADTGVHANDNVTLGNGSSAHPLALQGFAASGATVTVFRDIDNNGVLDAGEALGNAVADPHGRWTYTVSAGAIPDGDQQFRAVSGALKSAATTVTIDTAPPASVFALGNSVTPLPKLAGTTDPGVSVTIELDTDDNLANGYEVRYVTTTDAAGHWSVDTATVDPVAGLRHTFSAGDVVSARVTASDIAGNPAVRTDAAPVAASQYDISDANVVEGNAGTRQLVFVVSRSGDLSAPGTVNYAVDSAASSAKNAAAGLPGLANGDYRGADNGVVQFAAGESSKLVTFNVSGDYYREVNDKLVVKLSSPTAGAIGDGVGTGNLQEVDVNRLQAAYGLRDLNPSENDFAIRVRRSSDNAERDIGFDVDGELDRQALLNFVGTSASSKGYVTRWYDQSGHGRDMVQVDPSMQGVIVDGGAVVTRADGSAAFSVNNGRNGDKDDYYVADGVAATDWKSVVIYTKVQSEGPNQGSLFNLSGTGADRLSSHYPYLWADGTPSYYFDVTGPNADGRLQRTVTTPLTGRPNDVVFEGHSGNTTAGTPRLNRTDAAQVIYENGVSVTQDDTLPTTFPTTAQWQLGRHGEGSEYYQQVMYNEFLVYLAKDNSTPTIQSLLGSGGDDVLTYSGEPGVSRIDGLAGHDTLYLSGGTALDFSALSGGVHGIEQLWMNNGAGSTATLTNATLAANGVSTLTVQMGVGDAVVLNGERLAYSASDRQTLIIGGAGRDVVVGTARNDQLIGGGDADTFTWLPQQGGHDTVLDFSSAQSDRLDLSQLLHGVTPGNEDAYVRKVVGDNNQVSLQVDWDGHADFRHPDLTIDLRYVLPADPIKVVTAPGSTVVM